MRTSHPAIVSKVFRLVETLEFDLEANGRVGPVRIELFQDSADEGRWRGRVWERDSYRLIPSFAEETEGEESSPSPETVDEELLVDYTWQLGEEVEDFEAEDARQALAFVIDRFLHSVV
ncbi:MAG: hypothetical protein J7M29_12345 [Verrucomicrobia bacterium]|nr:hypothetical protein [Verrucomicrobiota bacterium]